MSRWGDARLTVVDAPSNLGLQPPGPGRVPGVWRLARTLRANNLVERLQALDGGRVIPAAYSSTLDPAIGVRNWRGVRDFALDLAGHVRPLLDRGLVPIVLGGDCSILLGPMLALWDRGTYGLVFIDGHDDLLVPATSRTGGAAGMDLALLLGHGPVVLSCPRGIGPLAQPANVAMLGMRNEWSAGPAMAGLVANRIGLALSLDQIRQRGAGGAADLALAVMASRGLDGCWLHLDADVLDNAVMPAVDSPQPGGLTYDELIPIVRRLVASGGVAGMTVTIYDPELDPTGTIGADFTNALVRAIGPA